MFCRSFLQVVDIKLFPGYQLSVNFYSIVFHRTGILNFNVVVSINFLPVVLIFKVCLGSLSPPLYYKDSLLSISLFAL